MFGGYSGDSHSGGTGAEVPTETVAAAEIVQQSVSVSSLLSDPKAPPAVTVCALGTRGARLYYRNMTRHRPYPSDLSDARWELLEPTLTA